MMGQRFSQPCQSQHSPWRIKALGIGLVLLSGCATGPQAVREDPLEPMNRAVFRFNDVLDRAVATPVAKAYDRYVPEWAQQVGRNFFNNLSDATTAVNAALQGKPQAAGESFMRFTVNSTFGLAGVLDIASEMRIPRHVEDFGQTLGRWGVPTGPYLVLPLLGPSSLRDAAATPLDVQVDPLSLVKPLEIQSVRVVKYVDIRARLLPLGRMLDEASLDAYSFARDGYLQKRRNDVYDGDPPQEPEPPEEAGQGP
jgi:phospholipid-binding lipoprotein MlaA